MLIEKYKKIAQELPNKTAIIFNEHTITYAQVDEITNKLANGLSGIGLKRGDRIALLMPNLPHFIFSYYAALKIGAIISPINYTLEKDDLNHVLKNLNPRAIICWEGFTQAIDQVRDWGEMKPILICLGKTSNSAEFNLIELIASSAPDFVFSGMNADDVAVIQYTSGMSELPVGVELSYRNLSASANRTADFFRFTGDDVFGAILPLFLISCQNIILNSALSLGSSVVLHAKLDYEKIAREIDQTGTTVLVASADVYASLLKIDPQILKGQSLKFCLSSWTPVPDQLASDFKNRFNVPLLNCYGLTESGGIVCSNHPSLDVRNDSVGVPLAGLEIQIHNARGDEVEPNVIGEVAILSQDVLKGYWNDTDLMSKRLKNGWLYTGDLGKKDELGYIYIGEKKSDVIVKSGFLIYTKEIEDVLLNHPKIKDAAVISIPHPDHKEDVAACLVLKKNETVTVHEIIEFCKNHMPVYKCPQVIKFYNELPRNKIGQILRRKLKQNPNS
ncbi:MAG: AMP-binding protein [Candidatus Zhuqueibacterota bacterium]